MPSETHRRLLLAAAIQSAGVSAPAPCTGFPQDDTPEPPCDDEPTYRLPLTDLPFDIVIRPGQVPDLVSRQQDDDPPRDAEGMLIGWPEQGDPDGAPVPMRPAWWHDVAAGAARITEARRARDRDDALIAAIGKLWR